MKGRVVSLDVLRGITIGFMILVNNAGDSHAWAPLKHADWNGFTPTDLVFPTFLFLVGVSMVYSLEARLSRGVSRGSLLASIVRRAAILFLLGLVVNGFPHFSLATLRIYGVLQRIAICYLLAGILFLWDRRPASKVVVLVVALIGYWVLMTLVPVPGLGLPGRDVPLLDRDRNLVAYLDRLIFPGRLYEGTRDPEGFLSNLPALGTAMLGMLTAYWLRAKRTAGRTAMGLLIAAGVCLALGAAWNPWFPINKKLWTSSYVLFAGGWSLAALAICYWAAEVKGWTRGWTYPWLVLGSNAIAAYVFAELLESAIYAIHWQAGGHDISLHRWMFQHSFALIPGAGLASFCYSLAFVLVCWLPMWVLYRRNIFIKV